MKNVLEIMVDVEYIKIMEFYRCTTKGGIQIDIGETLLKNKRCARPLDEKTQILRIEFTDDYIIKSVDFRPKNDTSSDTNKPFTIECVPRHIYSENILCIAPKTLGGGVPSIYVPTHKRDLKAKLQEFSETKDLKGRFTFSDKGIIEIEPLRTQKQQEYLDRKKERKPRKIVSIDFAIKGKWRVSTWYNSLDNGLGLTLAFEEPNFAEDVVRKFGDELVAHFSVDDGMLYCYKVSKLDDTFKSSKGLQFALNRNFFHKLYSKLTTLKNRITIIVPYDFDKETDLLTVSDTNIYFKK